MPQPLSNSLAVQCESTQSQFVEDWTGIEDLWPHRPGVTTVSQWVRGHIGIRKNFRIVLTTRIAVCLEQSLPVVFDEPSRVDFECSSRH